MKNKTKIIIILTVICILIFIAVGYFAYTITLNNISGNIKLDTDKYLTAIEVDSKSNFIIFIDKDKKISNLIFLNKYSIKSLYKQKVEGKNIKKGIESIVNKLNNNNEFNDNIKFKLIDYGNRKIYEEIKEEFNKQFVIYGINKEITSEKTTLEEKLISMNQEVSNKEKANLKKLYNYSLDLISSTINNNIIEHTIKEEDISIYATNLYKKLTIYATNITNQSKNSETGIDITTVNATGDYQNELYATKDSWYYIENNLVYADIKFQYNNKVYEYCFKGTDGYIEGMCQ